MRMALCVYAGVLGACVGSFLNVVIWRLPAGRSVVHPGSRCPACQAPIPWRHNVPVLAYAWLRGRCAACRVRIPVAYVVVEAVTALVFAALAFEAASPVAWLRLAALAALLIAAAETDRRLGLIPNRLVGAGAVLALALLIVDGRGAAGSDLLAALAVGALLLMLREGSHLATGRVGFGMGDVKLAAVMGLYLGWAVLWVFYLAVVLGGLVGLTGLLRGRLTRTTRVPFAPFLAAAAALHLLALPPDLPARLLWP